MRIIGRNFIYPTVPDDDEISSTSDVNVGASTNAMCIIERRENKSDICVGEKDWNAVIKTLYNDVSIDNDSDPYEFKEGYDGLEPAFPDRWWRLRVVPDSPELPRLVNDNDLCHVQEKKRGAKPTLVESNRTVSIHDST